MIAPTKSAFLNSQFRRRLVEASYEPDSEIRRDLWILCSRDPLFFINTFCIAAGTLVVTDRGLIKIEDVVASDKVWDGEQWVNQKGAIYQGRKDVISAYGIRLTPDHKVWTKHGWQQANDRVEREEIRLPHGYSEEWIVARPSGMGMPVRLRQEHHDQFLQPEARSNKELRMLEGRCRYSRPIRQPSLLRLSDDASTVRERELQVIPALRRTRNYCVRTVAQVRELHGRHGETAGWYDYRPHRQRQGVLAGELPLGFMQRPGEQHAKKPLCRDGQGSHDGIRSGSLSWDYELCHAVSNSDRSDGRIAFRSEDSSGSAEVYDLINCGPRRAFTVLSDDGTPLLVHNCWLLEARDAAEWQVRPRYGNAKELPFTLRQYQANAITEAVKHLGLRDIIMPKSRETGVTWIWVAIAAWDFIFHGQTHIGFVSKDEPSVDNPSDPDSLMSKLRFLLDRLPCWLRPPIERNVTNHTFKNLDNGSTITGYAATANLGRGGRKRWFLMDEFHFFAAGEDYLALDSTVDVTPCRVFVSTVNRDRGQSGAFYDLVTDDTRNGISIVIDWKDDEEKRLGLYHSERIGESGSHKLVIDDVEFWSQYANPDGSYRHPTKLNETYTFLLDGKYRSLYFDFRWFRPGATPQSVAAELERDFGGATSQIVDGECLRRAIAAAKAPMHCGDIVPDLEHPGQYKFVELDDSGAVKIWCDLKDGRPNVSECVAGADISYGTGGSNSSYSALEILNKATGEQVFEWRSNRVDPIAFGEMAVWVCRWFNDAYLVPEKNGGGGTLFIKKVVELGYAKLYHHIKPGIAYKARTEILGYFNPDGGIELLKGLESALVKNRVRVHSVVALREAGRYFLKNGKLVHSGEQAAEDGAAKGKAHGDAAIALSAAVLGMDDWPAEKQEAAKPDAPYGSFLWRRQQYEKAQRSQGRKSYWSPSY